MLKRCLLFRGCNTYRNMCVSSNASSLPETMFDDPVPKSEEDKYLHMRVALIGRPNVGKSTLFNKLAGKRISMTSSMPGLTRDRIEAEASLLGMRFKVFDTPGIDEALMRNKKAIELNQNRNPNYSKLDNMGELQTEMSFQSALAIQQSDVTLFMIDGAYGVSHEDEELAKWIRKHLSQGLVKSQKLILVANKCESARRSTALSWQNALNPDPEVGAWEDVFSLGLGEPVCISAEHNEGFDTLHHSIKQAFQNVDISRQDPLTIADSEESRLQLAVVGRANTGKSTLINTILGDKRLLTGPKPGVTRDCVAHDLRWKDQFFTLVDTAGLTGVTHSKIDKCSDIDSMSMVSSLNAIRFSNVVALTVDASVAVVDKLNFSKGSYEIELPRREKQIAQFIVDEGRALMIVLTKWDLVPENMRKDVLAKIQELWENVVPKAKGLHIVPVSGLTNYNVNEIFNSALTLHDTWNKRIATGLLNRWVGEMKKFHLPQTISKNKRGRKKVPKIRYVTQIKSRPPTFAMFGSNINEKSPFMRFLMNSLRQEFGLFGIPLRILVRSGPNPFVKK